MLKFLLKPLSAMSLPTVHRLGKTLGNIMYVLMPQAVNLIKDNLEQSKLLPHEDPKYITKLNMQENGKALLESLAIWQKPEQEVIKWVKACSNWDLIETEINKASLANLSKATDLFKEEHNKLADIHYKIITFNKFH